MYPKTLLVTLIFVIVTSKHTAQSVILRPDWFPYFKDETGNDHSLAGCLFETIRLPLYL